MTAFDRTGSGTPAEAVPWRAIVVTVLCLGAMFALDRALWDRIPEAVTTREAVGDRSGTQVPRMVLGTAFPVALVSIAAVMAVSARAGATVQRRFGIGSASSVRTRRWAMDVLFTLLAPFFLLLHAAVLAGVAGYDLPVERAAGSAVGLLLLALGAVLPRIRPARMPANPRLAAVVGAWQGAQRLGGALLMAVGAAAAAGALLLPPMPVAIAAALLVLAVYGIMFAAALRRLG